MKLKALAALYDADADVSEDFQWELLARLIDLVSESLDPSFLLEARWIVLNKDVPWLMDFISRRTKGLTDVTGPEQFIAHASVLSLLKKYPFRAGSGLDPDGAARTNLARAELQCRITNKRLRYYRRRWYRLSESESVVARVFHHARLKIQRILGPMDLNSLFADVRHGPGGAIGVGNPECTAYYKYAGDGLTVSSLARPYAEAAVLSDPNWLRAMLVRGGHFDAVCDASPISEYNRDVVTAQLRVVDHNKVTFVPKTAKTHRAIAVEPLLNVYLQLGVGSFIRRKLRSEGLDLNDSTRNQELARLGSVLDRTDINAPATLDVEMASDTLSIELVRELLPPDYVDVLDHIRSHYGLVDGRRLKWAKFSSMGNGFTFELETLIFYALASGCLSELGLTDDWLSVFGDDIIVPGPAAELLDKVLRFAGFRLNHEKSFVNGPFRESCGKDFFEGAELRPFFLKEEVKRNKDLIYVANSVQVVSEKYRNTHGRDQDDCCGCERFVLAHIPYNLRSFLVGPRTEDLRGHLWVTYDVAMTSRGPKWQRSVYNWSYLSAHSSGALRRARYREFAWTAFTQTMRDREVPLCLWRNRKGELTWSVSPMSTITEGANTPFREDAGKGGQRGSDLSKYVPIRGEAGSRISRLVTLNWR